MPVPFIGLRMPIKLFIILWFIMLGVIGRLVPHVPNMTPLLSLTIIAAMFYSKRQALFITLLTLIISDVLLSYFFQVPAFGVWTAFTYSATLCIMLVSSLLQPGSRWVSVLVMAVCACLFFWLWTNFGVWLTGNYYSHTWSGLQTCYVMALPFLHNQMIATVVWLVILLGAVRGWSVMVGKTSLTKI